ncbi:MAG: hypothetical protein ACYDCD_03565 [Candidatus Acidiferrales bacterium]
MIDKQDSRRIRVEIRHVLLDVWDPIGVRNAPNAQDEYDCCLYPIFRLLTSGASDEQIAEWLWRQADEHMGLGGVRKEAMYSTVAALRKIKLPSDSGPQIDAGRIEVS